LAQLSSPATSGPTSLSRRKSRWRACGPTSSVPPAIRSLLERTGVLGEDVEDMMSGCASPEAERALNNGRVIGLLSRLPQSSACATAGAARRSRPFRLRGHDRHRRGRRLHRGRDGNGVARAMMGFNIMPLPSWSLDEVLDFVNVELAERIAERFGLTRKDQERFAHKSLAKAMKALQAESSPTRSPRSRVATRLSPSAVCAKRRPRSLSISSFRSGRTER
jgi:acetyl-CoA acyltransferase